MLATYDNWHKNMACLGDNDRAAMVLFVQHLREQGELFNLLPRVLHAQHPRRPDIIPIITRNSQIRDIFTEIRAA